jgi:hypothetical protein
VVFRDGQVFEHITGLVNRGKLERTVQDTLNGGAATSPFVVR